MLITWYYLLRTCTTYLFPMSHYRAHGCRNIVFAQSGLSFRYRNHDNGDLSNTDILVLENANQLSIFLYFIFYSQRGLTYRRRRRPVPAPDFPPYPRPTPSLVRSTPLRRCVRFDFARSILRGCAVIPCVAGGQHHAYTCV